MVRFILVSLAQSAQLLTVCLGEIIYLDILGKELVLLNSEKVANDLLDKRSSIYSDRPQLPFHDM